MSEILPTTTLRLASISVITAITTKTGGASTMQIEKNIRCIVFGLRYSMAHHEGRQRLNNTN